MQFINVNNINMHYQDEGPENGMPIVFSNSLGTDFRVWDDLVATLRARFHGYNGSAQELRVIRYDKRGHGLSDASSAPYKMEEHVEDLAQLLDRLNVKNALVIGLSVGGMITQMLAHKHPERVKAIVLSNTAHRIGTYDFWDDRIKLIEANGIDATADNILERWFSQDFRDTYPEQLAVYRNMLTRTPLDGYLGTCAAIRDCDLTESTARLKIPALLIAGSVDGSTPPDLVKSTHELIEQSQFEVIEGVGHIPCVEQPGQVAQNILDFVEEFSLV